VNKIGIRKFTADPTARGPLFQETHISMEH